ncbi:threonine/serine exporter family protein [Clostridium sp. D2Q-11]|uniref:Threonine/serine exporter family protein n=1 Tax=Anaeromonas frigoriresistens TaxID=2683708 RepID=A0A942UX41_9FIRM|nr:threonine/serine exporter family protein [Anaeromonas frigoriresistens]MBS4539700.1 threonine/serine exporter family protein [Anaeromonas frigoriresistens]
MLYFKNFIFAFISTIGFSIIFNISRDSIIKSGLNGAIGWIIYTILNNTFNSPVVAAFFGALSVGLLGEFFARFFKKPATIFIIPGMVPLVPGSGMYYTMLAITEKRFIDAANIGSETIFIAAAIASAIIISISMSKIIRASKSKKSYL